MADTPATEVLTVANRNPGHRWQKGHPKFGGRRKKNTSLPNAVETCLKLSLNPILELARIYLSGVVVDPTGRTHDVDVRTRVKILLRISEHTHMRAPSLVAGEIEHRHEHANVTHLMATPELAAAAELIALAQLEQPDSD